MAPRPSVEVDLSGLDQYEKAVTNCTGPVEKAVKQWAVIYRAFAQRRFVKESRGGGAWPPLKRKRKRGKRENAAILRDTGTLFAALTPSFMGKPGQFEERIPFGVRVGFGGPARHPGGPLTVANLAAIHHRGLGTNPVREIIVDPDAATNRLMASTMDKALGKLSDETDTA